MRLDVQTGLERCILDERCILGCPIGSKLEVVRKVSVERDSLRVHVPVFWTRPSTTGVYKVTENSNLTPDKNQDQSDNIFGRYVNFESHNTRSSHESRDGNISPAEFELYNKYNEILHSCQKIEVLGMEIDSIKMTLSLTPQKLQKVVKTCQNLLRSHSITILELTRVIGLLSSTIQAVEPEKIQLRFFQKQQILCLRKKMNSE